MEPQYYRNGAALLGAEVMLACLVGTVPGLGWITAALALLGWSIATARQSRPTLWTVGTSGYALGIIAEGAGYSLIQPVLYPIWQQWVLPALPGWLPVTVANATLGVSLPNPFMGGIAFLRWLLTDAQIETFSTASAVLALLLLLGAICSPPLPEPAG
ncbi:MAG: hypothetical protein M3Z04_14080 [Chloroflexota bacterium]|nr:hypothetical protein [Chloroflexota bacterium]